MSAIVAALAGGEGRAAEIPDGTRLYLSKRGQAWFKGHFEGVLLANGIDLSRRRIEETEFMLTSLTGAGASPTSAHAKRPTPLEHLASNLGAYFKGVPFQEPPDLRFSMLAYRYELKFNHLTVEIDPRGPSLHGFSRGVVALLRGDASEFSFDLPRLRAVLPERPDFLGTLGLNGGRASLVKGGLRPAMIEIPILIDIDSNGLSLEVLAVRTNFTGVMLEASFEALLLPSIDILIDGRRYSFDRAAFEQEVRKLLPEILPLLQGGVKRFFEADSAAQIPLEFDLRLRIAANGHNEVELVPEEILLDTVVVNTRRTRTFLGLFKGRVKSGVMAKLKKANDGFRTAPSVLQRIAALDSVVGIPLRLVDVVTDNANVVLFSKCELP
jgi:hypothetical protein